MKLNVLSWFKSEPKTGAPAVATLAAGMTSTRNEGKGLAHKLKRQRTYRADMQLDLIEQAILTAMDVDNPRRQLLVGLQEQALEDAHLSSLVNTRYNQTLMEPYAFFRGDVVDEEITKDHKRTWFLKLIKHILETVPFGHSVVELVTKDGKVDKVFLIPREHVRPEAGEIVMNVSDQNGIPYRKGPAAKLVLEFGESHDLGLLAKSLKYVAWKRFAQVDWSRYSEKFGMPALFVKTQTRNPEELDRKEEMLANFGANLYALLDDKDEIEIKEATRTDAFQVYNQNIERNNSELSKLWLGQTMTSDNGSSKSQAEVHERVMDSYAVADMRMAAMAINEVYIPWAVERGILPAGTELEFDWLANRAEDNQEQDEAEDSAEPNTNSQEGPGEKKPLGSELMKEVSSLYASGCCPQH